MKSINTKFRSAIPAKWSLVSMAVAALLVISFENVSAQQRWSVGLRPGVNIATTKLGNVDLKTGFGFEGTLSYRFMPHLGAYAGWSWNKFAAKTDINGEELDFEETGYNLGLQFIHPIGTSRLSYLIKGGAIYNHIETENADGKIIDDSGHGWGWQIGGGVSVAVSKRWQLLPEVRYRSLSRTISMNEASAEVDLNYISAGIGVSYSF